MTIIQHAGKPSGEIQDPELIARARKTYTNLMAHDICSTQPMTTPSGLVYIIRPKVWYRKIFTKYFWMNAKGYLQCTLFKHHTFACCSYKCIYCRTTQPMRIP